LLQTVRRVMRRPSFSTAGTGSVERICTSRGLIPSFLSPSASSVRDQASSTTVGPRNALYLAAAASACSSATSPPADLTPNSIQRLRRIVRSCPVRVPTKSHGYFRWPLERGQESACRLRDLSLLRSVDRTRTNRKHVNSAERSEDKSIHRRRFWLARGLTRTVIIGASVLLDLIGKV